MADIKKSPKLVLKGGGLFIPPPGYEFKDGKWVPVEAKQALPPTNRAE